MLEKSSPMMEQWRSCKQMAEQAILFFRLGDFYEAFYEDAVLVSKELGLTLTQRQNVPMAGVPFHASEGYVDKLVSKGYRVAIAEQTEDARKVKGLVKREVTRVVTPGSLMTSNLLSDKRNNFFASVTQLGTRYGIAFLDLTTGEFQLSEFENLEELRNECYRIQPAEVLIPHKFQERYASVFEEMKLSFNFLCTAIEDWHFEHQLTYAFLIDHFQTQSLDGFGLRGLVAAINAGGALLQYVKESLNLSIVHIRPPRPYSLAQFMSLDPGTRRNLELIHSLTDGGKKRTLLEVLDQTMTPMGARLLVQWVTRPLLAVEEISKRQGVIGELRGMPFFLEQLREQLAQVHDLERLMMKIQSGYALPRDLVALRASLEPLTGVKAKLQQLKAPLMASLQEQLQPQPELLALLQRALVDTPPLRVGEGPLFREGYHPEIDALRALSHNSQTWLLNYQTEIRESTGIKTLKVGFNRLSGYYIEVSKGQTGKMPESFERRQTLANAERYITPTLKDYESKVLLAEEQLVELETQLFQELKREIASQASLLVQTATALGAIDCLQSLAQVALLQQYVCPVVDESDLIEIQGGRHPIIEGLHLGEKFVPNEVRLDEKERLFVITGPNMAGKSTYLRQVALIVILAQIGSFVPASTAHIGVVDKVFTRIGASDDLSRGQSTFMVEMSETANILNNATDRSLVILDEIGRGTSTYDGISIAWAVAEYLLTTKERRAKTLFATHYWELTELEKQIAGAVNYNIAVRESQDRILFLRKIVRGVADKSYGIHVGALAGLPSSVLQRARQILTQLEKKASSEGTTQRRASIPKTDEKQLLLFEPLSKKDKGILDALRCLDLDNLTPLQAQAKLAELKTHLR